MKTQSHNGSQVLPTSPRAGVGLHFSSLPSAHGIGDIGDASIAFVDTLKKMSIGVWQFLPTGPTAYGDSPYQPLSAFAGNENLIGVEPLVRAGLLREAEAASLHGLPAHTVDYGNLIPAKREVLVAAAGRFPHQAGPELKTQFDEFLHRHLDAWLADYALYRIIKTMHGERPWPEWDPEFVHREQGALDRIRDQHRAEFERIKIIQFLFDRQWKRLNAYASENRIRLFGDMPIYIALDSADAWAHPEILLIDDDGQPSHIAGVPPDYFSEDGQLWGNPLYDWDYHEEQGFTWWIDRIRHAAEMSHMVRVDHFRGFESFWSVPFGEKTARKGRWKPGPRDALFLAMEQALGSLPIVAEDLGVITKAVDGLRLRHSIPGMVVLQFEIEDEDFVYEEMEEQCVCYTGTHDNDTTIGWFLGTDDDTRTEKEKKESRKLALEMTGGSRETIHIDLIRLAFESNARLAVAPMQDFLGLGSEARLNKPGTTLNNWRWRVLPEQLSPRFKEMVKSLVEEASRG